VLKRTKIIATLGPATDELEILNKMIAIGVDLVRINLSHGTIEVHERRIAAVRASAKSLGKEVGILVDLQGPKIRIARFREGVIHLKTGSRFIIDADLDSDAGTIHSVGVDYKNLPKDVSSRDILLLGDGLVMLSVEKLEGSKIHCIVKLGGRVSNNQGINRRGGGLRLNR